VPAWLGTPYVSAFSSIGYLNGYPWFALAHYHQLLPHCAHPPFICRSTTVTPYHPTTGQVCLLIVQILNDTPPLNGQTTYSTFQQQIHIQLQPWQCPLFGSLWKVCQPTSCTITSKSSLFVTNALIQKNGHSGFAWLIAHEANPLRWGQGLTPGPANDMHAGWAEAFGLLVALIFLQYYLSCYGKSSQMTIQCFYSNNLARCHHQYHYNTRWLHTMP